MFEASHLPFADTGAFTSIILQYLADDPALRPFHRGLPSKGAFEEMIEERKRRKHPRQTLVAHLRSEYEGKDSKPVQANITALLDENTFTVTTAHQPNLFTGPLYFFYKIAHTIGLASYLQAMYPLYHFVPVYYMGSEDADVDELAHFQVAGKRYKWQPKGGGAFGRMQVDAALIRLIDELEAQIGTTPFGGDWIRAVRQSYVINDTIAEATFSLIHTFFEDWGLVVLNADAPALKREILPLMEDDLFRGIPSGIVGKTSERLEAVAGSQAHSREINLFYLTDGLRNRIVREGDVYAVIDTDLQWNANELRQHLNTYPDRFSPNVILRGLYQETLLPNLAFVGGGGELAYWLQLKDLFAHYAVPFPLLVLRNSFLIVPAKERAIANRLRIDDKTLFQPLLLWIDKRLLTAGRLPDFSPMVGSLEAVYLKAGLAAASADPTLRKHAEALKADAVNKLMALQKKMLRAERRKESQFATSAGALKSALFPNGGLQERTENMAGFYGRWGSTFIESLIEAAIPIDSEFIVLKECFQ